MNEDFYISLIYKQLQGELTSKENDQLNQWLDQSTDNQSLSAEIKMIYELSGDYLAEEVKTVDVDKAFEEQLQLIKPEQKTAKIRPIYQWRSWVAAAVILFVGILGWQLLTTPTSIPMKTIVAVGGKYEATLPDNSKVWLKSDSRIQYAKAFKGTTRRIELEGTAVFDVVRDEAKPFIVHTKIGQVKVLGTKFSLAYDANTSTLNLEVLEGKVNIQLQDADKGIDVVAGEQVIGFYKDKKMVKSTEKNNNLAWFNNKLEFKDKVMSDVLMDLKTHFKVDIKLENPALKDCPFTSIFENKELSYILKTIDKTFGTTHRKQAKTTYILRGGTCE